MFYFSHGTDAAPVPSVSLAQFTRPANTLTGEQYKRILVFIYVFLYLSSTSLYYSRSEQTPDVPKRTHDECFRHE